jgi:uroporphyrinogen-III decarboxylase
LWYDFPAVRNHRLEIESALGGDAPGFVPFSFYDVLLPAGLDVSSLQARGMSICARRPVVKTVMPEVTVVNVDEGSGRRRTTWVTPVGTLTEVWQEAGYGALGPVEHLIKRRDDYRVAEFMVKNTRYQPAYQEFLRERERIGDAGYTMAHCGYSPLEGIQIMWLGQERFCYEIADNEDAVMSLYQAMAASQKAMYRLIAAGPAEVCLYGGNIVAAMLGPKRVRDFVLPCFREFADLMEENGKKLGSHMDADNRLIMDVLADSGLHMIEAFTPPPDCSVSVEEARRALPNKVLWVNFPASVLVGPDERIRRVARDILQQAGDRRGFLMGVTEDVPRDHLVRSVSAVLDVINEHGDDAR